MKVILGGQSFKSCGAAKERAREILNSRAIGDTISVGDKDFLIDSLKLRGERGLKKIGCGVLKIVIGKNEFGGRCFFIHRTDGSKTDFSYIKCFSGHSGRSKPEKMRDFEAACRTSIRNDRPNTPAGYQAHHADVQFKDIVKGFLETYNLDYEAIEISGLGDGETTKRFKNRTVSEMFRKYHTKKANIVVLSVEDHKKAHARVA